MLMECEFLVQGPSLAWMPPLRLADGFLPGASSTLLHVSSSWDPWARESIKAFIVEVTKEVSSL